MMTQTEGYLPSILASHVIHVDIHRKEETTRSRKWTKSLTDLRVQEETYKHRNKNISRNQEYKETDKIKWEEKISSFSSHDHGRTLSESRFILSASSDTRLCVRATRRSKWLTCGLNTSSWTGLGHGLEVGRGGVDISALVWFGGVRGLVFCDNVDDGEGEDDLRGDDDSVEATFGVRDEGVYDEGLLGEEMWFFKADVESENKRYLY